MIFSGSLTRRYVMSRLAFAAATLLALAFVLAGIGPKFELSAQDAIVPFEYELIPDPNPYQPPWPAGFRTAWSWGQLPAGRSWGSTSAVHVDIDGKSMWAFERCGSDHGNCLGGLNLDPMVKFDPDGNPLVWFGAGMFINPHGVHIDREGNIWATDVGGPDERTIQEYPASKNLGHRVVKFSPTGEVLMVIGTGGVAGASPNLLTTPTGAVTAPNGDIFITEGHGGNTGRVSKFAPDGTFIMSWGNFGSDPGEFNVPHDIAMDSQGRVFVADRMNYRIQIFDQEGKFIDSWKQFGQPSGIYISPDDVLYVTDSHSWGDEPRVDRLPYRKGVRIGSARTGKVKYYLPDTEVMTKANSGGEGIGADYAGNVYVAVVRRLGVEKHPAPPDLRFEH